MNTVIELEKDVIYSTYRIIEDSIYFCIPLVFCWALTGWKREKAQTACMQLSRAWPP